MKTKTVFKKLLTGEKLGEISRKLYVEKIDFSIARYISKLLWIDTFFELDCIFCKYKRNHNIDKNSQFQSFVFLSFKEPKQSILSNLQENMFTYDCVKVKIQENTLRFKRAFIDFHKYSQGNNV